MELQTSEISHVYEEIVIDLYSEMAALLDEDGQAWLLLCELIDETIFVSECFPDFHAYLSTGLFGWVEVPVIEYELLILKEHWNSQKFHWLIDFL